MNTNVPGIRPIRRTMPQITPLARAIWLALYGS